MANEAAKRYDEAYFGSPIQDYNIADAVAVEKGAILELLDARKVSGATTLNGVCAGIAAREKIAGNGVTQISVYKKGYFDVTASGAITLGAPVSMCGSGTNKVQQAGPTLSGAAILGYAEETVSDAEVFILRLNL